MKYMLYVYGYNPEDNMTVECESAKDLGHYALAAIMQETYKTIRAEKDDGKRNEG